MTNNDMEYDRYFDSKQRRRNMDYNSNDIDSYHDGIVMPSPPYKVSKLTAMSTPNPQSKSASLPQQRSNSMSSNDDTKTSNSTTYSKTPTGGFGGNVTTSNTTPPTNKAYKGLRHFSLMVCKKVEEKGTTTYNEVADELVRQILDDRSNSKNADGAADTANEDSTVTSTTTNTPSPRKEPHQTHTKFDEKNIRRRVYDALNVLMAMNIIIKDKKAIMWRGLPTSLASASMILPDGCIPIPPAPPMESFQSVQNDIQARTKKIQKKREMIKEFVLQHVCFRNLVERNYQREQQLQKEKAMETSIKDQSSKSPSPSLDSEQNVPGKTSSNSSNSGTTTHTQTSSESKHQQQRDQQDEQSQKKKKQQKLLLDNKIPLPFIVINTNKNAVIQCNMSRDLTDVMFDFTMPFEINDDNSILKRLQLYVLKFVSSTYRTPFSVSRTFFLPFDLPFIHKCRRHQTNHQVLRQMLPDHIYQYCETNRLLDDMIFTNDENIDNNVSSTFHSITATSTSTKTAVTMQG